MRLHMGPALQLALDLDPGLPPKGDMNRKARCQVIKFKIMLIFLGLSCISATCHQLLYPVYFKLLSVCNSNCFFPCD